MLKREEYSLLDRVVLGRAIFTPPFRANAALEEEARFVHVVHGKSTIYFPNGRLNLSTGDSIIMKCENFVNHWLPNEGPETNEVIILRFFPEVLQAVYDNQLPDILIAQHSLPAQPVELIAPNPVVSNFVQGLKYYLDHPAIIKEELLRVKIQELILVLLNTDRSGQVRSILSNLFRSKGYEFKEVIHSHLYEDLSLEELAFFTGMSLSSFKRKFKEVFANSPTRYIKAKRLEKAKHLLETSDLRITEIAYDCGFNDPGYFSKSFTAAFKLSPSEYRSAQLS